MTNTKMDAPGFVDQLAHLRFADVFNPYVDRCETYDLVDAAHIRRKNLTAILDAAFSGGVDSLWVARDLGYRGGRRTGLALTDDVHVHDYARMFNVQGVVRATHGAAVRESTANVIWSVVNRLRRRILLWNVFPLHPHTAHSQFSNRSHTRHEREVSAPLLSVLIQRLQPATIVAIGADAHAALLIRGVACAKVRHPSHGGSKTFVREMGALYGIAESRKRGIKT